MKSLIEKVSSLPATKYYGSKQVIEAMNIIQEALLVILPKVENLEEGVWYAKKAIPKKELNANGGKPAVSGSSK